MKSNPEPDGESEAEQFVDFARKIVNVREVGDWKATSDLGTRQAAKERRTETGRRELAGMR